MRHAQTQPLARVLSASWLVLALCIAHAEPAAGSRKPKAVSLDDHSLPALGASMKRKVDVQWNRYYDHAGLGSILARLHQAFPELTKLYSLGKSVEGRDLWCLEITSPKGDAKRKPGMYIDGNIHGNEVQGAEAIAYTAWYLCHQHNRLDKITDLLDHTVFYLIPTINPDGRDRWLHNAHNMHSSRSGLRPFDNDRDGLVDEDDADDLDGDGAITQMRIKDPHGRWKPHPQFPEYLMNLAERDAQGEYTLLGAEGIDNDGDGQVNEDPAGGYDMNRNWAWDWQPNYIQFGAQDYPFSLPESRAIAEFFFAHPNLAAAQSFHNSGAMILRSPGREGGQVRTGDDQTLQFIAQRGEKILPFYRSMVIWRDLYTVWGGSIDWFYSGRGVLTFSNELWTRRNLNKGAEPSREDEIEFLKNVLLEDGLVPWHEFDHPTYGKIQIGGFKKEWGRTPPSFLLEEECHRNMAFTLYHASQMPRLKISNIQIDRLGNGLHRLWVTIENQRLIPTRTEQDIQNHISPPDIVSIQGDQIKAVSAGIVRDRFFKRVEPVERRPARVEIPSIPGRGAVRVQFVVSGAGSFTVTLDSAKGGLVRAEDTLP